MLDIKKDKSSVIVLVHDGFEETELVAPVDMMRRAGNAVSIVSMTGRKELKGAHGIVITADSLWEDGHTVDGYNCVFLPGGGTNAKALADDMRVTKFVFSMDRRGKFICAICAAPMVLERAGLLNGKTVTSYPGCLSNETACRYTGAKVEKDGNIITGRGPAAAFEFGLEIVKALNGVIAYKDIVAATKAD